MPPKARQNSNNSIEKEGRLFKSKKFAVFMKLHVFSISAMKLYIDDLIEELHAQKYAPIINVEQPPDRPIYEKWLIFFLLSAVTNFIKQHDEVKTHYT
ncbi:hypothetical protein GB937_010845 [Aspergillus fischeri]|nr:hypothetical protein GB937_010845 [Aspergillus fischeri]